MRALVVRRVYEKQDMRLLHAMRRSGSQGIDLGEATLWVNRAKTMARLIDAHGGVHAYYAEPDHEFDLQRIKDLMGSALGLRVVVADDHTVSRRRLRVAA